MKLPAVVKPGTRVDCNVRGRVFSAEVIERTDQGLRIKPPAGITYHTVTPRQVSKVHRWDPETTQVRAGVY